MKIGLALAGGGVKGSYQIGSFLAFKKCHIKFDCIWGTSIGSFNGALLASKMDKELLNFWQNIDVGSILGLDKNYVDKIVQNKKDFEFYKLTINNIKEILINKGISITGLQNVLEKFDIEPKLRKSKINYGLITYRLKDLKPLELFKDAMKEGSINNYIMSSCYLPIFKQEKLEDDSYYFDGGIYDNCPANMMLKLGYDRVYRVELKAIGYKQRLINKEKVITISPSRKLSGIIDFNRDSINNNIWTGYYDTIKVLKKYPGYKYIFKKYPDNYYKYISSKVDKKLFLKTKVFLNASDEKDTIIKALEYTMKKENETYFKIYSINKILKKYKKSNKKYTMSSFINKLKTF